MFTIPILVFVRHGETDWNVAERLQGQQDIPLNDNGRNQARRNGAAVAAAISDIAGYEFMSSPLSRSRETMELARAAMNLDPAAYEIDLRLREIGFGTWEGSTLHEVRRQSPEMVAAREKDKWGFVPPRGESYGILSIRVAEWVKSLERPTFAVAHGGVGRVLRQMLLGLDPHEAVSSPFPQDRALVFKDGAAAWI